MLKSFRCMQQRSLMNCPREKQETDMGIGEKASVECVFALCWLQAMGDQIDLSVQLRDQMQALMLQLQLLNNILICTEHCSEDMELNYLLEGVGKMVSDIHSSLFNGVDRNYGKIQGLGSIVTKALKNMDVIKTDIVLIHVLFSKLSCSQGRMSDRILLEFLEMSMENLKGLMKSKSDLLAPLKEQIGILEEKLRFLRKFVHFARNGYIEHENLGHLATIIGAVVDKVGCLGALYWIDEMDDDMASSLRLKLSQLLQMIELVMPEVKLILIKFQKASMLLLSNKTTITDKLLWDFVSFIIESLKEFIKGEINLMGSLDYQVESLHLEFILLRTSLIKQQCFVKKLLKLLSESYRVYIHSNSTIKMVDLLTHMEAVSKEAATAMNSFGMHDTSDEERALGINFACFDLLEKFIPFCSEGMQDLQSHIMKQRENAQPHEYDPLNCLECQEKHEGLSANLKDAIQRLKMKFGYLQLILRRWSGEDCDFGIIDEVIKATSPYCHKACVAIKYGKLDSALSNLTFVLSYVNDNEELGLRVKKANNHFQVSSSPSVMTMPVQLAEYFVNFLIKNVVYLLHCNFYFISSAKTKMEVFEEKLRFLRGFLNFTSKWCIESEKLKKLLTRIGTMADNAAHLSYWCFFDETMEQVANEVKLITSYLLEMIIPIEIEVRKIYPQVLKDSESSLQETPNRTKTKMEIYKKKNEVSSNSFIITDKMQGASNVNSGIADDVVVGFEDVVETILDKLVQGSSQRDVISIVGMTGIGKTTVARKIYNICVNECYFDVCSWCRVSIAYVKNELLTDLLCQVELPYKIEDIHEDALPGKLKKGLRGKRYLIIIDDIWSTEAWEDLQRHFPDDNTGSRIIITTQINEVAQNAKIYSDPISLRFLEDKESWMLLQEKLQYKESHQPDLVDIGKQIAKKCHGLPLSVVLVAGLLSRVEKTPGCWRQVSESLSVVRGTPDTANATIEFSYKHLPEHLKLCFLYFGVFSEDKEIPVSRLTRLWIAEGFVLEKDMKSSEEVAEEYLMDLIGRNLVINSKNNSRGRVKTCRVHDAVRNFCLLKSKEEDFLQRVHETHSPHSFPQKPEQHRISVYSKQEDFANWRPSYLPVRSLLFKAVNSYVPRESFDISSVLRQFKLLLVLDLGSLNGSSFPREVQFLIHLKYLAVRINTDNIPAFIDNLQNLETFLVKGRRKEILLPDTLWNMVRLRHLHVDNRASFGLHWKEFFKYSYQLENLKTLSTPTLGRGDDSKKIIRRLPNLQKLRCWFMESWEAREGYSKRFKGKRNQFPALDFLSQLESLNVFYCGHQVQHPCEFNFPSNLKKLTLSNFRLPWSEISKIAESLTKLEVLDLKFNACNDKYWEVGYEEFPSLKVLTLDRLNVVKWNASEDAFPFLQQLVLRNCKYLEEIPSSMGSMATLQTIDVQWCKHAVNSAIQISNDQHDLGNVGFKVSILPLAWDPRASP